ncbi:MAG: hypothetical protein KDA84_02665 [Planctomycetaceae bacterium]|nr:hypothetical protein [Planctomycetaceae bacterium]
MTPRQTAERVASLPTERTLTDALPQSPGLLSSEMPSEYFDQDRKPADFFERMRPTFNVESEWLSAAGEVGIFSYGAKMNVPTYPIFGPPPPLIQLGFSQTQFWETGNQHLPNHLSDFTFGVSWVRRLNDRWTLRMMTNAAFASDGDNTSGDAWQFRGDVFAIYSRDPQWIWTVGVLALGRNDLPAVPAIGLIWQPSEQVMLDLILPRPRLRVLLRDGETRQQWGYVGGGFSGGTWAYQQSDGSDDQVTYGDWRLVIGWESVPHVKPGVPFQRGRKLGIEAGYSFARDIEFDSQRPTIDLGETFLLRTTLTF